MSYIYIGDASTASTMSRLATRLGKSTEEVIQLGLDLVRYRVEPSPEVRQRVEAFLRSEQETLKQTRANDIRVKLDAWRAANPLPPPTGLRADKAFFDEMWGEDSV